MKLPAAPTIRHFRLAMSRRTGIYTSPRPGVPVLQMDELHLVIHSRGNSTAFAPPFECAPVEVLAEGKSQRIPAKAKLTK